MDADDDPGLYFFDPSDLPGAEEYRAESARQRAESRRRYTEYLAAVLIGCDGVADATERAEIVLDALAVWRRDPTEDPCRCSCHPRLPESDLHDYGFACTCMQSPEERARAMDEWFAARDAFWEGPEGRAIAEAREAEESELAMWLAAHPGVVVTRHGGWAPEIWEGSVDGREFFFRERHEEWRIELDLRGTGRFVKRWRGGDLDDEDSFDLVEVTEGDVIARGTTGADDYGTTPAERIGFIVDTIRGHVARQHCEMHVGATRDDLAALLGESFRWCPSCGSRLV